VAVYTTRDLVTDALLELGVIGVADEEDPDVYDLALRWTISMVDVFQADRLLLFTALRQTYPLVGNKQAQTIGPAGADFIGPRPVWVSAPAIIPVGDVNEIPIDPYTAEAWDRLPFKTLTDLYPHVVRYEPTSSVLGTFSFWPIASTGASFVFSSPVPLQTPATLDTVLLFAPAYREAWRLNLAKRLQRPFKRPVSADLELAARDALSVIRRLNDGGPPPSACDPAITGRGGTATPVLGSGSGGSSWMQSGWTQ
jgi:hypothetical protein